MDCVVSQIQRQYHGRRASCLAVLARDRAKHEPGSFPTLSTMQNPLGACRDFLEGQHWLEPHRVTVIVSGRRDTIHRDCHSSLHAPRTCRNTANPGLVCAQMLDNSPNSDHVVVCPVTLRSVMVVGAFEVFHKNLRLCVLQFHKDSTPQSCWSSSRVKRAKVELLHPLHWSLFVYDNCTRPRCERSVRTS
jgi:hypothetical protein